MRVFCSHRFSEACDREGMPNAMQGSVDARVRAGWPVRAAVGMLLE